MTTEVCNGICVTAADIGVGSTADVAYPHPLCPEHGAEPEHEYRHHTPTTVAEYTTDGPLVIEGIIEDGEFRQTNGQSFIHWLAAHDRAVEVDAFREAAQGQPTHIRNHLLLLALQMEDGTK